ncbi:unnamed protein product [Camellia sinensis]
MDFNICTNYLAKEKDLAKNLNHGNQPLHQKKKRKKKGTISLRPYCKQEPCALVQELHSKEVKSSYDSYLKGLTILKK